jgi:hypothetical protein
MGIGNREVKLRGGLVARLEACCILRSLQKRAGRSVSFKTWGRGIIGPEGVDGELRSLDKKGNCSTLEGFLHNTPTAK